MNFINKHIQQGEKNRKIEDISFEVSNLGNEIAKTLVE